MILTKTEKQAAEILRQASAELFIRGRIVGDYRSEETGAVCAFGAIREAASVLGLSEDGGAYYLAFRYLNQMADDYGHSVYTEVNDEEFADVYDPENTEAVRDDLDYAATLIERGRLR